MKYWSVAQTSGTSDQVDYGASAEGAAEGSQGWSVQRATPGSRRTTASGLKGRQNVVAEDLLRSQGFCRPFRARILDLWSPGVPRYALPPWLPSAAPSALAIALCAVGIGLAFVCFKAILPNAALTSPPRFDEDRIDHELQRAVDLSLGKRDGTVIVMDPQTGRVRALVNPELAFASANPPGSSIKPFTALAALRKGLVNQGSRLSCRENYVHEDFTTVCSHHRHLPPLGPSDAIAYSCNYYFGKLGEQMRGLSFSSTLDEFGFGKPTQVNWTGGQETAGKLPDEDWRAENAMGEGEQIRVTPIQLINAYSALLNGGHLFTPRIAPANGFAPQSRTELRIENSHRQLIIDGMRGSVRFGNLEQVDFRDLPLYVFGKTGTSTQIGGFRTQGWFVGFAAQSSVSDPDRPENLKLAVLVFLKRAHGRDAAQVARPILEAFVRAGGGPDGGMGKRGELMAEKRGESPSQPSGVDSVPRPSEPEIRVHLIRENVTHTISLEDYVRGVVATEGSTETEPQALKALSVAVRTYALKNLRRHANEGYDFCNITHCQRYRSDSNANPFSANVVNAVRETNGRVLQSNEGQTVDAYFSASCGGATADIGTLWNVKTTPYLTTAPDDYCLTMPHHAWTDVISSADLLKAMQSDPRTDVGTRLTNVRTARRDASGRAQTIIIEGEQRRVVSGWDFKIIVGRALGWHLLKSSRFEIARVRSNYAFRGSGFGHGLGLCQEGAHVMARRGSSYQTILAKYFPRTHVGQASVCRNPPCDTSRQQTKVRRTSLQNFAQHSEGRRTLTSEHFRLGFPTAVNEQDAEGVLRILETSRADLIRRVSAAGVTVHFPALNLFINRTTGDFVARTGQPSFAAAATRGQHVELQPLELLQRRGILETTLRHELAHVLIDALGGGRTPRWLAEGLAIHLAGEGQALMRYQHKTAIGPTIAFAELESRLSAPNSAEDMRAAYATAYHEVRRLLRTEGERGVWARVASAWFAGAVAIPNNGRS